MADRVPAGAFPECEQAEQKLAQGTFMKPVKAFTSRRESLTAMRTAVNEHDVDITKIKEDLANLPFPFAVRS